MATAQIDKTQLREYLLQELPSIFEEDFAIQHTLGKIFEEQVIYELAEAQRASEHRLTRVEKVVEELAEAQKRTEQKVEELAEAQKRTEQELHTLVKDHKETRRQLGGLSDAVGYGLEDKAYPTLPALLQRNFRLTAQERLTRRYVKDKQGHDIEVNIFAKAIREGKEVMIVGESKSQLSKNDVREFVRKKLKRLESVFPEILPVLITYMITSPDVEDYVKEQGIALYYSYDFISPL